jgi:hypothetical protein
MLKYTILSIICFVILTNQKAIGQCTASGSSLVTSYVSNNSNKGEMFDIVATNTITLLCFDLNLIVSSIGSYEIYYKVGSYIGSEMNPTDWILIGSNPSITCAGFNLPTPMDIPINIVIPAGQTYGFYITGDNVGQSTGIRYTNNAGYTIVASDANINISGGIGKAYPFLTNYNNRSFNGSVHYVLGDALPVEFTDFTASEIGDSVLLEWQTESEKSNDYFEIEHSKNGSDWDRLFIVKAAGESNTPKEYQVVNSNPLAGINYYRLSQFDLNGKQTYLKTISWSKESDFGTRKIKVFPNPSNETARVFGDASELRELVILNAIGQNIIEQVSITNHTGYSEIDLGTQKPCVYLIKTKTLSQILIKE